MHSDIPWLDSKHVANIELRKFNLETCSLVMFFLVTILIPWRCIKKSNPFNINKMFKSIDTEMYKGSHYDLPSCFFAITLQSVTSYIWLILRSTHCLGSQLPKNLINFQRTIWKEIKDSYYPDYSGYYCCWAEIIYTT